MAIITPSRNISASAQIGTGVVESTNIKDNDIAAVDIATDAVAAAEIKDGEVGEAEIGNDAVSLAELKAGTAGNLISFDAAGDPVAVATGTATQVLKSNGAGAAPTFQDATPVPITFCVAIEKLLGGWDDETLNMRLITAPDAVPTSGIARFFMPSEGTISSIQFFIQQTNSGGNWVFDFECTSQSDETQQTDSALNQLIADGAPNQQIGIRTIPATAYDGLTRGRWWSIKLTRDGGHASDNTTSSTLFGELIVNMTA